MYFYKIDYAIEKMFTTEPREERLLLKRYTGASMTDREATSVWESIRDHKWYLSERLKRDVGFHVAAVDYMENFYAPRPVAGVKERLLPLMHTALHAASVWLRAYFEAKGRAIPFPNA